MERVILLNNMGFSLIRWDSKLGFRWRRSSTTVARSDLSLQFYNNKIVDNAKPSSSSVGGFYFALKTASNNQNTLCREGRVDSYISSK